MRGCEWHKLEAMLTERRLIKCMDLLRIQMCVRPEGKNCEKRECREHTPALLFVRANRVSLSRETPTRVCCTVRYIHPCARALEHSRFRWRRSKWVAHTSTARRFRYRNFRLWQSVNVRDANAV